MSVRHSPPSAWLTNPMHAKGMSKPGRETLVVGGVDVSNRRSSRPNYGANLSARQAMGSPCRARKMSIHKGPSHPTGGTREDWTKNMNARTIGKYYPEKRRGFASNL